MAPLMAATLAHLGRRSIVAKTMARAGGVCWYHNALPQLDPKKLTVTHTANPQPKVPKEKLAFGRTFTDHMLEIDWSAESGWGAPRIKPFGNLSLSPATVVFHYGIECFEGLKVYKDRKGAIRLFRPEKNMERLARSTERFAIQACDPTALLECIKELVKVDQEWIPEGKGYSVYLRPTVIGTQPYLGVRASDTAKLFVIGSPVGPYYKAGFAPVSLLANPNYVRAWPRGIGSYKTGCNYGPCVIPQVEAADDGYDQLLWLMDDDHKVTEAGTMNFFMMWQNDKGERELITPPLDGVILAGVTRDSILELCRTWGEFKVTERTFTMGDIITALQEKRVEEMFGAGTAAIVSPIKSIGYLGKDYAIPLALGTSGKLAQRLSDVIMDIQYGETPSPWSVVVD